MKRIPNKTAIATICYGIKGTQKVKVYDYNNEYDLTHEQNEIVVFDGVVSDLLHDWRNVKYSDSEYHGMKIEGDTIIFQVFTKFEEYK